MNSDLKETLPVTFGIATRIWWAVTWRGLVIVSILGLVIYKPIVAGLEMRGTKELIPLITALFQLIAFIPVGITAVFWVLRKGTFGDIHLTLVSVEPNQALKPTPPPNGGAA
ncbi:MAG: hypothetical protein IPP68_07420 [Elusimicrobia bacterium]|nr:hypothetical protein [Elusimicrobiota bacterium]